MPFEITPHEERVSAPIADSVGVDPVQIGAGWRALPRAAQQIYAVTALDQARKDFPEVKLGPAGLGIFVVLPVQYEYPH
jgi:hypothetical protein